MHESGALWQNHNRYFSYVTGTFFPVNYSLGPKILFELVGSKMILIYLRLTIKRKRIKITNNNYYL